jgi:transcriptional regulator of NAD metabolism
MRLKPKKDEHAATRARRPLTSGEARAGAGRPDSGHRRRRLLVDLIRAQEHPIRGADLARRLHVSRQCLVQDVAMLRAGGEEILSTPQGYRFPAERSAAHRAILACRHAPERTAEELQILVDHGVRVIDVVVEHPLYGELRGSLMIESRADVEDFLRRWRGQKATLLSSLTRGVHLHTVEANRPEMISRAKAQLQARGLLLR